VNADYNEGLEDKIDIKKKNRRILKQTLKSCERNTQELRNSIKRSNLKIVGIEEEDLQAKGTCNIFYKVIAEKFLNLKKELSIQLQPP
jgi:hypothetical protein